MPISTPASGLAIAAPNQLSVNAGHHVLSHGGNAVDAAIAAMLVTCCTEIGLMALQGGGFINIWPHDGKPVIIDGNVSMPGCAADPDRFGQGLVELTTDYQGGTTIIVGPGSVAVPGALAAMHDAHQRYGKTPWRELFTPAINACRQGYTIGSAAAFYLSTVAGPVFSRDPQASVLAHRPDGAPLQVGDTSTNQALATTLERIAAQGAELLYTGEIGQQMATYLTDHGGLLSIEDLATYQAIEREPIMITVGEWELALNPPPSIGGPMLAIMLREAYRSGAGWEQIIAILHRVVTYRHSTHDLADDLDQQGWQALRAAQRYGLEGLPTSANTAHVSSVDAAGNMCSLTASVGYGSGICIPGTGLLLNNALGEPELNRRGLHSRTPGQRLATNMAPVTGRCRDGRRLAIGSPGADRITTALLEVLVHYCRDAKSLITSVQAPRVHVRRRPDNSWRVDYEQDPELASAAQASGLPVYEHPEKNMFFGGVAAAVRLPDGHLAAVGDPRRTVAVGVW